MSYPIQPTPILYGKDAERFERAARRNEKRKPTKKEIEKVRLELKRMIKFFGIK
jgi:hypothetical protein